MKKILAVLGGLLFGTGTTQAQGFESIPAQQFAEQMKTVNQVQLIDVRTPGEYADGHLQGATLINAQDGKFAQRVSELDTQQPVFVYCRSGRRSAMAAQRLAEMGFVQVIDLRGGIMAWSAKGLPVTQQGGQ